MNVINKSNTEQEERMNGLVEDLERIAAEIYEIESKLENSGMNSGEEILKL